MYASVESLSATLECDFKQEKSFTYNALSRQEIIEHIAQFISYLWQIHIFGGGNTRTTAFFLIKYLRKLGYKDNDNDLFAVHSWYFRNALVRANYQDLSKGIHKTDKYIIRFLLNLIHRENYQLKNREMHVSFVPNVNDTINDTVKAKNGTVNDTIISLIKQNNKIAACLISERLSVCLNTAKRKIKELKDKGIIERIGSAKTVFWKIIEQ